MSCLGTAAITLTHLQRSHFVAACVGGLLQDLRGHLTRFLPLAFDAVPSSQKSPRPDIPNKLMRPEKGELVGAQNQVLEFGGG